MYRLSIGIFKFDWRPLEVNLIRNFKDYDNIFYYFKKFFSIDSFELNDLQKHTDMHTSSIVARFCDRRQPLAQLFALHENIEHESCRHNIFSEYLIFGILSLRYENIGIVVKRNLYTKTVYTDDTAQKQKNI